MATQEGRILALDYDSDGIIGMPEEVAIGVGSLLLGIGFDERGHLYASSNEGTEDSGFLARLLDRDDDGYYESQQRFITGLPNAGHHNDQIAIVGRALFFGMGSRTDDGEQDMVTPIPAATILHVDLDKVDFDSEENLPEVYAFGLRNAFGITIDEQGRLWVGDNGRDTPLLPDELHMIIPGAHHGFPSELAPAGFVLPVLTLGLGTSADGLDFYPAGGPWGDQFAGNIFISRFDYELDDPSGDGMDVVRITLDRSDPDDPAGDATTFASGFFHPLDVEVDPFGNLLVMEYGSFGSAMGGRILRILAIPIAGDLDGDRRIDLNDFVYWSGCVTGPRGGPCAKDCCSFDFDVDGDVDFEDFRRFSQAYSP